MLIRKLFRSWRKLPIVAGSAFVMLSLSGCGSQEEPISSKTSKFQAAEDSNQSLVARTISVPEGNTAASESPAPKTASKTAPQEAPRKPPVRPGAMVQDLQVPSGGPDQLLAFADELGQRQPQAGTNQEMMEEMIRIHQVRLEAVDKVMAGEPTDEQFRRAAEAKLESLHMLARLQAPGVDQQVREFCQKLRTSKDAYLARLGRVMLFGLMVGEVAAGEGDTAAVMKELEAMLKEEEPTEEVFAVGQQAAMMMQVVGQGEQATKAMAMIGNRFKGSENQRLAEAAQNMLLQVQVEELALKEKMQSALQGNSQSATEVVQAVGQLLAEKPAGSTALSLSSAIAQNLEYSRNFEAAGQVYEQMKMAFADHPNAKLIEEAKRAIDNGQRRMGLLGQPFEVEGSLVDGRPFDWKQYEGKVVLVDFWATWCGPCLEELPNIKAAYAKFRDKGFEVVGINLDENPEDVKQFLNSEKLPWQTVLGGGEPGQAWYEKPMAAKCGVDGIPFLVLVNQQGVVETLHVRGELLEQELTRLLGPADAAATVGQGTQPPRR